MGRGVCKRSIFGSPWVWGEQSGFGALLCLGLCKRKGEEVAGGHGRGTSGAWATSCSHFLLSIEGRGNVRPVVKQQL